MIERGVVREFFGFNRGKHAVVEAAILATRVDLLESEFLAAEFQRLRVLVEKTGGDAERRAFEFLQAYLDEAQRLRRVTDEQYIRLGAP